jgi:hypothetical protein
MEATPVTALKLQLLRHAPVVKKYYYEVSNAQREEFQQFGIPLGWQKYNTADIQRLRTAPGHSQILLIRFDICLQEQLFVWSERQTMNEEKSAAKTKWWVPRSGADLRVLTNAKGDRDSLPDPVNYDTIYIYNPRGSTSADGKNMCSYDKPRDFDSASDWAKLKNMKANEAYYYNFVTKQYSYDAPVDWNGKFTFRNYETFLSDRVPTAPKVEVKKALTSPVSGKKSESIIVVQSNYIQPQPQPQPQPQEVVAQSKNTTSGSSTSGARSADASSAETPSVAATPWERAVNDEYLRVRHLFMKRRANGAEVPRSRVFVPCLVVLFFVVVLAIYLPNKEYYDAEAAKSKSNA